ncbi:MAG: protein translocase subunit SecD [Candidatus Peregrinibacteria bacterium]|nr:protein translocase subunit SecD [Candidatus Peregrinibacteria bacterium]
MSARRSPVWSVLTVLVAVLIVIIALPDAWKGWAPGFLRAPMLHLGLDLAGGTQLDFRISEQEMEEQLARLKQERETLEKQGASAEEIAKIQAEEFSIQEQQRSIVEAIRTVIERRINALGVSEATITPSYIGAEKHLFVECPGIIDTQECIATVGKTIQLEFKEEFTEVTEDFTAGVRTKAQASYDQITKGQSGITLQDLGQDLSDELGISYIDTRSYFRDALPDGLDSIWTTKPGEVRKIEGSVTAAEQAPDGSVKEREIPGVFLAEVLNPPTQTGRVINEAPKAFSVLSTTEQGLSYKYNEETLLDEKITPTIISTLRGMQPGDLKPVTLSDGSARVLFLRILNPGRQEVAASHILVSYKDAQEAPATVTRTKDEALTKAQALKARVAKGENFTQLARQESDGPSRAEGGNLGTFTRGTMVPAFETVAFTQPAGSVSDPVETPFGYHLIRVDKAASTSPDNANFDELVITGSGAATRAQELVARLQAGKVTTTEEVSTLRILFFSLEPTGWKDTTLDGKHFRSAAVTLDPVTNIPVVQINFDEEGGRLFQELTKKNIGKSIAIFVGGELVSAPVVQQEISGGTAVITGSQNFEEARRLAQDLNTGAIPAPIHLVGQQTIEATLGDTALQTSLQAAILGVLLLIVYLIAVYRLLGVIASGALLIYAVIFFAILKLPLFLLSDTYVVLTLAGMAGIILSIGMAVDANVLVFERMKEELRKGKLMKTAVETSFQHAWPAIRDGNVSTIITCTILFLVGTSIVRGFAITLGMGVLLSMFSAITVTRWMLRKIATMPVAERLGLFGVKKV